jgi:hypothetical protein
LEPGTFTEWVVVERLLIRAVVLSLGCYDSFDSDEAFCTRSYLARLSGHCFWLTGQRLDKPEVLLRFVKLHHVSREMLVYSSLLDSLRGDMRGEKLDLALNMPFVLA